MSTVGFQTGDNGTGEASRALVDSLRSDRPPFDAKVVGQASGIVDFRATVADRALWAIGLVVLATLVLLFLMTGSVVIPVKALVMNVLSLGAALGVTVWIFEDGHLEDLLRFTSTGAAREHHPAPRPGVRLRPLDGLRGLPPLADRRAARAGPRHPRRP